MNAKPIRITESDFDREVRESAGPVLVDFWADWCGPCHVLAPTIEELAAEYQGAVKVAKVEIDENPSIAAAFGVRSIPTVILFQDGEPVKQFVGVQPKENYEEVLKRMLNQSQS